MKKTLLSLILLLSISFANEKVNFYVGVNEYNSFDITDEELNDKATFSDTPIVPLDLGVRSSTSFFSEGESGWGYFIESGFTIFYIDQQELEIDVYKDYDTSVKGISVHVTPVLVYQASSIPLVTGVGFGIGALHAEGNYEVTNESHPQYQNREEFEVSRIDLSFLINIEFFIIPESLSLGLRFATVFGGNVYNQTSGGFFGRFYF